jgi:hypothetical protein
MVALRLSHCERGRGGERVHRTWTRSGTWLLNHRSSCGWHGLTVFIFVATGFRGRSNGRRRGQCDDYPPYSLPGQSL